MDTPGGDPTPADSARPTPASGDMVAEFLASHALGDLARRWLPEIVERVVGKFHPDKVVLFGALARGDTAPRRYVEVLVVMPNGSDTEAVLRGVRRELHDVPIPKDIAVSTVETLAGYAAAATPGQAAEEGVLLYERG